MKQRVFILVCVLFLAGTSSAQSTDSLRVRLLAPAEFRTTLQNSPNGLLVDVREFFEYKKSRIKSAVNIPSSGNLERSSDTIGKDRALFLYCTSGFRSKRVAKFFASKGSAEVYSLDGGITAWKKAGMPIDHKRIRR